MKRQVLAIALAFAGAVTLAGVLPAQTTTHTRTTRRGATVAATRSRQDGQVQRTSTVTTADGKSIANSKVQSLTTHGRVQTTDTRVGANGTTTTRHTVHGARGNETTVTGPQGESRTFVRRKRS